MRRLGPGPVHALTRAQPPPWGTRRGGTRRASLRLPPRSVSAGSGRSAPAPHRPRSPARRPVGTHSAPQRRPMAGGRPEKHAGHWVPRVSATLRSANGRGAGRARSGGAGARRGGSRHARDVQGAAAARRGGAGGAPAHLHVPPAQPAPRPRHRRAAAGRSEGWAEGAAWAAARGARPGEVRHAAAGPVFPPVRDSVPPWHREEPPLPESSGGRISPPQPAGGPLAPPRSKRLGLNKIRVFRNFSVVF